MSGLEIRIVLGKVIPNLIPEESIPGLVQGSKCDDRHLFPKNVAIACDMVQVVEKTGRFGRSYVDSGSLSTRLKRKFQGVVAGDRSRLHDAFVLGPLVTHVIASLAPLEFISNLPAFIGWR